MIKPVSWTSQFGKNDAEIHYPDDSSGLIRSHFLHVLPPLSPGGLQECQSGCKTTCRGCGCLWTKSISTLWAAKRLAKNNPTLPAIAPRSLGRRETGRRYRSNSFGNCKTHYGYQYPINPWKEG